MSAASRTVVADTQALLWRVGSPERLGRVAEQAFAAADQGRWLCYVPVTALIEIWLLVERGRISITPTQVLDGHPGYAVLAQDLTQALEFGTLTVIRDPMDRMIVAAARATGSRLISADRKLSGHGVVRVWD